MKIAIMGKGGSGKSSLSWLLSKYISKSKKVVAIDADHNMDLTSNLGILIDANTPTIHRKDSDFRKLAGMPPTGMWKTLLQEREVLPICIDPIDDYSASLRLKVNPNLDLIIGGLGCEDNLEFKKCSHGHLASLKYWLAYLPQSDSTDIIIDSVAGVDMLNYGLYLPCDLALIVVENLPNSIKVAQQISQTCTKIGLPFKYILNKSTLDSQQNLKQNMESLFDQIVGIIPIDNYIISLNFESLKPETLEFLESLEKVIRQQKPRQNIVDELKNFESKKV